MVFRSLLFCFALATVTLTFPAGIAAQLATATWEETVMYSGDVGMIMDWGQDPAVPEPRSIGGSGSGWEAEAAVSFTSPGPPNAVSTASAAQYSQDFNSIEGHSSVNIMFEFEFVEIAPPPVPITLIPIIGVANASVSATANNSSASANVQLSVGSTEHLGIVYQEATAMTTDGPQTDSFTLDWHGWAELGEIFQASVGISTSTFTFGPTVLATAEASAEFEPTFSVQVKDQIIGGTSPPRNFREFYRVVFGPGFWSLGNPNPVDRMTWGQVKKLYGP
jgi:hypothetical protein